MVVIVPAFAEAERRDPPAVAGVVSRLEAPRAPHVRRRIHEPRRVQSDGGPQEHAPQHPVPAPEREQHEAERRQGNPMIFADPDVERIASEVGCVFRGDDVVVVQRVAEEDPPHVRPEPAVLRRMRIEVGVGMLMMFAMGRDPEQRAAFECERRADGEEIFDGFRRFIRPVREQPVIGHADAERERNVIRNTENGEPGPCELKERPHRADVEKRHEKSGRPRQFAVAPELGRG